MTSPPPMTNDSYGSEHRYLGLMWKPDGVTATHRARCSCGWVSRSELVGYGYPLSHEEDHRRHVETA